MIVLFSLKYVPTYRHNMLFYDRKSFENLKFKLTNMSHLTIFH